MCHCSISNQKSTFNNYFTTIGRFQHHFAVARARVDQMRAI